MKNCVLATLAVALHAHAAYAEKLSHPVSKVIALLGKLAKTSEAQGESEALDYQSFAYWCKNSQRKLSKAIASEKEQITTLKSDIASKEENKETMQREISKLEEQLKKMIVAAAEAKDDADKDQASYDQEHSDLASTIKASEKVLGIVVEAKGTDFMQLVSNDKVQMLLTLFQATALDSKHQKMLTSLLEVDLQREDHLQPDYGGLMGEGDLDAHADKYKSKAGTLIELLKDMISSYKKKLNDLTKAQTNNMNAYELEKQARDESISAATKSKDEQTKFFADAQSDANELKSSLESSQEDLAADSDSLAETQKTCNVKAQQWAERSKVRKSELKAISAAIDILSKVTGIRTDAPSNPLPPISPVTLLDMNDPRAATGVDNGELPVSLLQIANPRAKAIQLLRDTARTTHSAVVRRLAQELSMHMGEPFDKVTYMIQKMIHRLIDEQTSEDEHKLWCDTELSKTNTSIANKDGKISELTAKINSAQAKVQSLTLDIENAEKLISELTSFKKEATQIREAGKKENSAAIRDSQDAQTAIAQATDVLRTYYEESGMMKEAALVQKDPVELPDKPSTWDSEYTGVSDPTQQPDGIISVLQKTASAFATMEADTKAQEATDQDNYEEEMKKTAIEKARRSKESEMKTLRRKQLLDKIDSLTTTEKRASNEVETVKKYLEDLEPACVSGDSSYEDRKAAREQEVEALKKVRDIFDKAFKDHSLLSIGSKVHQRMSFLQIKHA